MRVIASTLVVVVMLSGCGNAGSPSPPVALLSPYQGPWQFDARKTDALWRSQLTPADRIAWGVPRHPDMTLSGSVAVLPGPIEGEYAFFALHRHDQWVCGKAWHHEDRQDHGDMGKCYVRLERAGPDLHLSVRMHDGHPDLDDPDLTNMPPTAGSKDTCSADAPAGPPWSPWMTYVFVRGDG